jgi:hypothetical protein
MFTKALLIIALIINPISIKTLHIKHYHVPPTPPYRPLPHPTDGDGGGFVFWIGANWLGEKFRKAERFGWNYYGNQ